MNRIYNVIWSKAKNCYVVVSELVKSGGGKASVNSARTSITFRAALCAFAITGCLVSGIAEANVIQGPGAAATGSNSVAVGDNAKSAGAKSVAIGNDAATLATSENGIAIGNGAKAEGQQRVKVPYPAGTIAIGQGSVAKENGDIVIGRQAKSTISKYHQQPGSGAVVMGAEAASYGSRGDVVIGAAAEANIIRKNATVDGDGQLFSQSVAIGSVAKVYGTQSVAIGGDVRSIGQSSIAIGGDDIDQAKPDLYKAIPDLSVPGTQKNFNREVAALYPSGLGTAGLNDSKNYVNTASIGNASLAIGMMTQSLGTGSNAIGANSLSKGVASSAIGAMARSWGNNSLAIGSQAGAYGEKSTSLGDANIVGFDMTNATLSGSAAGALGRGNKVYGNNAYAIGSENTVGTATVTETTESNGDKIKKVTAGTVKGNTAGAFGYKNTITTDNSYVVGSNSTISADNGMVLGNSATVTGANGLALGNNTKVANDNAVAIGNGSETAATVATPSATINGVTHNFAGTNPASTVSVGKAGMERTVTNVAAGRISATSTDAINGSQLFAVKTEVEKGVSYAGDVKAAAAADNKFTRKLGEQTNVVGGVTDVTKLTDNNIGVVSNGTDTLNIKLAKTLTGLDSVTAGGTTINNGGLTVDGKNYVSPNGINANNQKITNVADGTNSNDAVNYGQLQNVINSIDKAPTVKAKDANVTVTEGTNAAGGKEYIVGLGNTINVGTAHPVTVDGNAGHITGLQNTDWSVDNPVAVPGRAATEDQLKKVNDTVNNNKDQIDKNKQAIADNKQNITTNAGNIANNTQNIAKNAGDIVTINKTIEKGLNFDGDSGATINKKLGDTVAVKGGATGTLSDNNIGVVSENGKLNVKLAKDLTGLNSVTTGQTTINNDGLTIGGKKFVTANGFDANDTQIKNVKAGTDGTDAVNLNQLNEVKAASDTKVKAGKNIDVEEEINAITKAKTFTVGLKDTVTLGSGNTAVHIDGTKGIVKAGEGTNAVTINGTEGSINAGKVLVNGANGTVNNLTNRTWDPNNITNGQAATEDQLKVVDNKIDKNTQDLTKKGLNFKGDSGEAIHKDLGQTLELKGGESDASKLSNGNIGVVNENGNLNVKLAKNLKGLDSVTVGSDPNKQVVLDDKGVSVGGKTYISNEGLNANNQKITNVAAGVNDTDAVNVQQLKSSMAAATTTVKAGDSGNTTVETTVNADKSKTYTVDIKKDLNLRSVITTTDDKKFSTVTNGVGVTSTDTFGNKTTLTADNVKVSDGQNNTTQTTAKGVLVDNPTKSTELTVNGVVTTDKKTKRTSTTADGVVVTSGMGSEKVTTTVSSNGVAITTPPAGQGSPKDGTGAVTLTKDGLNNGGNKVVNMASGYAEGEDINNIADNSSSLTNGANIGDLKKGIDGLKKAGLDFAGDKGEFHRDLGQKVTVKGGVTDESKLSTANNIGVISDNNGSLNVRLAKDITGINSITTMDNSGHTTVTNGNGITIKNNGGGSVSLTSSGLNNGGNKITNVAPGEISSTSTDAVNGSQLNRVANSMNNVVNEVRQVGAMSSALSALKPMAYDPYEPTQIMAGYGNYRGDSALALGVAHYKNESMMLHAGVAWAGSNSHMMANAGVTWKVGNRDGEAETADRYRKGPISSTYAMQRELAAMKAENQGLKGEVADLKAENEQMKANIAAMMARLGL